MTRLSIDQEFRRGWRVLLAAILGMGFGLATLPAYTIGVFAPQFQRAFGWSMGQIMGGYMLMTIGIFLVVPFYGWLADRIGTRPVALFSVAAYAFTYMAFSLNTGALPLYMGLCILLALVGSGSLAPIWVRSVNASFDRKKGLALGISAMGTGVTGSLVKLAANGSIELFGWRGAYVAVGFIPLLILWTATFFLLRRPPAAEKVAETHRPVGTGLSMKACVADYRFWLLALIFPVASFAIIGPIPNLENILRSHGIDEGTIILVASLLGISIFIGRLLGGYLIDKLWGPLVACVVIACPALACLIFALPDVDVALALAGVLLIGFGVGAELDLVGFFVARYFGQTNYATIYGIFYGLCFLAGGVGPWAFGYSFDLQGSYSPIMAVSGVLLILCALAFLALGRYRYAVHAH